ncbi:MAG: hypothetical protein IPK88_20300 [Saprospiraceae bacterium]|nr:hypothetical protein [Candidatus Defluviibacterium haderslevense]MBK8243291.1 hypothetical protein [Candidatus Defluviibacterium haderslevense]MBK8245777.1 hypothetical protein [Candidatus Defluviibacterium haderslevense]
MEFDKQKFIEGLNTGHLLANYEPKLVISFLINIQPINSYLYELKCERNEFELSKAQLIEFAQIRNNLREDNFLSKN